MRIAIITIILVTFNLPLWADGDPGAGRSAAIICIGCHTADGNSDNPAYPKLAGQKASYIAKQLRDFKNGVRKEQHMSSMVEAIGFADIDNIAAYFSQQKRKPANKKSLFNIPGKAIFFHGIPAKKVPACFTCHGQDGRGDNRNTRPSLAGQHVEYLVKMLQAFRKGERQNDPNNTMRSIASSLSDEEIQAVAGYLASLN